MWMPTEQQQSSLGGTTVTLTALIIVMVQERVHDWEQRSFVFWGLWSCSIICFVQGWTGDDLSYALQACGDSGDILEVWNPFFILQMSGASMSKWTACNMDG